MPAASVTPEYLLEGAAYALEQCGLLLRDANLLYQSGSYVSAVALSLQRDKWQCSWRCGAREIIRAKSLKTARTNTRFDIRSQPSTHSASSSQRPNSKPKTIGSIR